MQTIQTRGADFVYSDEIVLGGLKELGGWPLLGRIFAPDYLGGVNFITHLAVFSRPPAMPVPTSPWEFDGAQTTTWILRSD